MVYYPDKTLLVGPWVGEFGWELFCWQGLIRRMAKNYGRTIVACRRSSKALYEDFTSDFIWYDTDTMETDGPRCKGEQIGILNRLGNMDIYDKWYYPEKLRFSMESGGVPMVPNQEFIIYGERFRKEDKYVAIHARSTDKIGCSNRNWSEEDWTRLTINLDARGYEMVSIGTQGAAMHIEGTIDCRGLDLKHTFEILRHSKYIMGPSSGPMHLASLCGTDQLVWSGDERNYDRYTKLWNPHNTNVVYIDTWQPTVDQVLAAMGDIEEL